MLPMVINSLCFGELTAFSADINKAVFCGRFEKNFADADYTISPHR